MVQLEFKRHYCDEPRHHGYLCEFGSNQEAVTSTSLSLLLDTLITNTTQYPVDHVVCPAGHVTHTLFSCDARTSCWAERHHVEVDLSGSPDEGSCPAPVAPLPPYFRCQRGLQVVAYTVVCDHRENCEDGSDEGFCVFPACRPGTEMTCNNEQVSPVERLGLLIICCYLCFW